MNYLVDSDWLIDASIGKSDAVRLIALLRDEGLAISIISYGEVLEGAVGAPDPTLEIARFHRFFARFAMVPLDATVMEQFAFLRADLRRRGQLIPDLDLLIAATSLSLDLTLLTRNIRHFARVPGLRLYIPT